MNDGRHRWWPFLVLYVGISLITLLPLALEIHHRLPDDGDSLQNLWIVWWGSTHFHLGYPGIYEANGYYPNPLPLAYSEPQLTQALLSWPLFHGLENRVLSYNLLVVLSLSLSAFGAHLLLRDFVGSSAGAFVGAIFYAFSAYAFSQLARPQLLSLQWMPLALFCLHRFFFRKERRYLIGFTIFSILLALACFYYLQFYAVVLALVVPACLLAHRGAWKPKDLAWLAGSIGIMGIPILLNALPFFTLFRRYGFEGQAESYDLLRFFQPPAGSLLYGALDPPVALLDQFLGYLALPLAGIGLWHPLRQSEKRSRLLSSAYLALGATAFFFAGGPDLIVGGERLGPGPYVLLKLVKPLGNLRDPYRFSVIVRLALSLFVAAGAARLLGKSKRPVLLAGALGLLLIAEQWTPRKTQGTPVPVGEEIPDAYRALAESPAKGPLAELPVRPYRQIRLNTLESYFSTFHQRPILVGNPSFPPPSFELLRWELRGFPDFQSLVLLDALGVEQVLVHPKRWGAAQAHFLAALDRRSKELPLLERFPDRDDELWAKYQLGAEQLHAVVPLNEKGSPRSCDCREIDRKSLRLDGNGVRDPELAVDGDVRTKWTTGDNQREGHFFEIAFDRPRTPVRIEIEMVFPYQEFARNLKVNGFRGERFWRIEQIEDPWYVAALIRKLVDDPMGARLRYDLEPMEVDRLRLFIHETEEGVWGWSIAEIRVFEENPG